MLWRGLKTACHHSLMYIDHFLKDVDQWYSHNPVWCLFVQSQLWVATQVFAQRRNAQRSALKARLTDLVHLYCDSTINSRDFTMHKECFRAINRLRKNDDIIITKLDKGSGVVLLNKSDYIDKINEILDDQSKFKRLGPVSSNDNTASIESRLQKRLLDLVQWFSNCGTRTTSGTRELF